MRKTDKLIKQTSEKYSETLPKDFRMPFSAYTLFKYYCNQFEKNIDDLDTFNLTDKINANRENIAKLNEKLKANKDYDSLYYVANWDKEKKMYINQYKRYLKHKHSLKIDLSKLNKLVKLSIKKSQLSDGKN